MFFEAIVIVFLLSNYNNDRTRGVEPTVNSATWRAGGERCNSFLSFLKGPL